MNITTCRRAALLGATALISSFALQAAAQAADQQAGEDGEEFIGTVELGESKRDVQTDTATPVTRIDKDEIDDRQASSIAELIDSVPGVSLVNGSTPIGSGINIRGFGANGTYGTDQKVAIQIDGASVGSEEIYRVGTQLFTDPYLYKNVEVIRGTVASFEYGSGIIGGVVRLETIDASDMTGGEPGFKLGQTLGAYSNEGGFSTSTTAAWQPTQNLEFLGNYSYREQGDQEDGDGNAILNSAFELPSWLLKAKYSTGAHSLTASYTETETQERDKPYDSFGTTGGSFGNVDRDTKSRSGSLRYNYNPFENDLVNIDAILSYADQKIDAEYVAGSSPLPAFIIEPIVGADNRYETTKLTVKNTAFIQTGSLVHDLRTGIEYIKKDRKDANSAPGGTDDRLAAFIVDEIEFGNGWVFSPALRYETSEIEGTLDNGTDVSYDNDALMGGASLRYEFANGFSLFGSYAYTESLPIIDDLQNPAFMMQPEIGKTVEFGGSYDRVGVFGPNDLLALKVNYYQTDLEDNTSYSGVDSIELHGFEIEGSYARRSGFYIDLNANIVDGEQTSLAGAVSDWVNAPADTVRLTVGQRVSRFADISAEVLHAADTEVNGTNNEGYTVLNLRTTLTAHEGVLEGTSLRLGVENLLDESFTPYLSTRPAPGRNLKVTISKAF